MTERDLHKFTLDLLRNSARRGVLYLHIPNGVQSKDGARAGRWQVTMGMRRGAADWLIVMNGKAGFLELKRPASEGNKRGEQNIWQRIFEGDAKEAGALYAVARTPEEVESILYKWGAIKKVEMQRRAA